MQLQACYSQQAVVVLSKRARDAPRNTFAGFLSPPPPPPPVTTLPHHRDALCSLAAPTSHHPEVSRGPREPLAAQARRQPGWSSGIFISNSGVPRHTHTHPYPKIWFNFPNPTGATCQTEALGTSAPRVGHRLQREGQVARSQQRPWTLNCRLWWVPREPSTIKGEASLLHGQGSGHRDQGAGPDCQLSRCKSPWM